MFGNASKKRKWNHSLTSGISLVEILLTITIASIVFLLLAVGLNRFAEKSKAVACLSNLRRIGAAVDQWSMENGNFIPITAEISQPSWMKLIAPYLGLQGTEERANIFRCPGDPSRNPQQPRTYRYNTQKGYYTSDSFNSPLASSYRSRFDIRHPSSYAMLFDVAYVGSTYLGLWQHSTCTWIKTYDTVNYPASNPGEYPRPHYEGNALNILFYDGHAEKMTYPLSDTVYYYDYDR